MKTKLQILVVIDVDSSNELSHEERDDILENAVRCTKYSVHGGFRSFETHEVSKELLNE